MKTPLIKRYAKFLVGLGGATLTAVLTLADANALGNWGPVVVALATALGVRQVPNAPKWED